MFHKETRASIENFSEMRSHIQMFDKFCETVAGARLLPTTCEVFNQASFGNCLWKANLEEHGEEPRTSNHLVLTVGDGWQYLGSIRRISRLRFTCPELASDASTFELECFYCDKWWQVEHADNDYIGGGACVTKLPGHVIPEKTTSFSPWFPIEQAVPNNVVTVRSVLSTMKTRDSATRKRRRANIDVDFVCMLGRSNMVPGSMISTTVFQ
ncbi:hypothetical protein PBRA_000003 [Plasmodiophora brassicae]|nr:hypothetical protein PBRA_000003 [Plasmodiophora brassicae]